MDVSENRRVARCGACNARTVLDVPYPGTYRVKCVSCAAVGTLEVPADVRELAHGKRTVFQRLIPFRRISRFDVVYQKLHSVAEYVSERKWEILAYYLVATVLAEFTTALASPLIGLTMHALVLVGLLAHAGVLWIRSEPLSRVATALSLLPLIRIVSLTTPLAKLNYIQWFIILGGILYVACFGALRVLGATLDEVRVRMPAPRHWLLEAAVVAVGVPIGMAEFALIQPGALLGGGNWVLFVGPSLLVILFSGYLEELIFRGVLPRYLDPVYGAAGALVVPALAAAVLDVAFLNPVHLALVFATGLLYGAVARRTGSLFGVGLSHGVTNVLLFLVLPVTGLPW